MIYTGIGSRETPDNILAWMDACASWLAGEGLTLRSGGSPGADQAFERGAAFAPTGAPDAGKREIYLPWEAFESEVGVRLDRSRATVYPSPHPEAYTIAAQYHPRWTYLSYGAKMLHARNTHQILGWDLNTPTDFVVCWTKDGKGGGGTGQALRIAKDHDIPIYDTGIKGTTPQNMRVMIETEMFLGR